MNAPYKAGADLREGRLDAFSGFAYGCSSSAGGCHLKSNGKLSGLKGSVSSRTI